MNRLENNWTDLYELLGVESDADEQTLLESLCEYEARGKSRLHQKFIAQYRRILLDPDCRNRYNQLHARHQAGDPTALEFPAFLSAVRNNDLRRHLPPVPTPRPVVQRPPFGGTNIHRQHAAAAILQPGFCPALFISTDLRRQFVMPRQREVCAPAPSLLSHSPALSRTSVHILTGIVATLLISYIQSGSHVVPGL